MKLTNWRRATYFEIDDYGQVGAGRVVEFIPRGKRKIILPATTNANGLITLTVSGDSLRDMGIHDGDDLYCRVNIEKSDIKNGRLVVARIPGFELVVKFFYEYNNKIVLRSANPHYQDLIFEKELVEIKAVVVKSVKTWE